MLPTSCADFLEIWGPQLPGILRACPGVCRDCFTFLPVHQNSGKKILTIFQVALISAANCISLRKVMRRRHKYKAIKMQLREVLYEGTNQSKVHKCGEGASTSFYEHCTRPWSYTYSGNPCNNLSISEILKETAALRISLCN
jgi:hypothetical protein